MSQAQQTIRVLFVQGGAVADLSPFEWLGDEVDVVSVESLERAQDALADSEFDFVVASPEWLHDLNRADLRPDVPTPVTALGQAARHVGMGQPQVAEPPRVHPSAGDQDVCRVVWVVGEKRCGCVVKSFAGPSLFVPNG